ncbi:MAG: substrate-binding domain-containing protein [Pirellulales bacterium]|nr:substrate-binding domain-containing protein [Pirellulales bacterium]
MFEAEQQTDRLVDNRNEDTTGVSLAAFARRGSGKKSLKYKKFKRVILADLRSGILKPGDLLPTVVQMSNIHGVAPNTIRRALVELDNEGIIRRVRGKGTFIREGAHQQLPRRLDALGLIVNETSVEPYPALFRGLEMAAEKMHSQVLMSDSRDDPQRQGNIILQLLEKRVAGVVIVPSIFPGPPHQIRLLQQNDIPVVCCHRRVEGVRTPLVALPFTEISRLAGQALVDHGHRNIAMVMSSAVSDGSGLYIGGMRDAVLPAGGTVNIACFNDDINNHHDRTSREKHIAKRLSSLMAEDNRPTALMFCFDDDAALAYLVLTQMGYRIPEDVSLISFGGKARKGALTSRITSVTVDGTETGRLAGKLIKEMIDGDRAIDDTEEFMLNLELYQGGSLARV